MNKIFVTAIKCMDGRTHLPVIEYLKSKYNADYVDLITEPGPNKILAEGVDSSKIQSALEKVSISVDKHGSKVVAVCGHFDCAGNPLNEQDQKAHLLKAAQCVQSWNLSLDEVICLWIDENLKVCQVS